MCQCPYAALRTKLVFACKSKSMKVISYSRSFKVAAPFTPPCSEVIRVEYTPAIDVNKKVQRNKMGKRIEKINKSAKWITNVARTTTTRNEQNSMNVKCYMQPDSATNGGAIISTFCSVHLYTQTHTRTHKQLCAKAFNSSPNSCDTLAGTVFQFSAK